MEGAGSCNGGITTGHTGRQSTFKRLSMDTVLGYLLEKGHISPADIVDGQLTISDRSGRNRNYAVHLREGGIFVKQSGAELSSDGYLLRELSIYQSISQRIAAGSLDDILPRLIDYDPQDEVILFELVRGDGVADLIYSNPTKISATATAVGRALAGIHDAFELYPDGKNISLPNIPLSDAFTSLPGLCYPGPGLLATASAAQLEICHILQQSEPLQSTLARAAQLWRRSTLIHGDLRSENIIVSTHRGGETCIVLVDLELGGVGDPAWDLACMFADMAMFWACSIQVSGTKSFSEMAAHAEIPLARLRPLVVDLWKAYVEFRKKEPQSPEVLLSRIASQCVSRLVQRVFEQSTRGKNLTNQAILMLQIAENIAINPSISTGKLFGI